MIEDFGKRGADPTQPRGLGKGSGLSKSQELNLREYSSVFLRKRSSSFKSLTSRVIFKTTTSKRKKRTQNAVDKVAMILSQTDQQEHFEMIREEINQTIEFTLKYRHRLIRSAKKSKSSIYLNPDSIDQFLEQKKSRERYKGCHIQANPNGTMYIIPKKKFFKLGHGTFKYVRLAVELGIDGKPKRAIAFARVSIKKIESVYRKSGQLKSHEPLPHGTNKVVYDSLCKEVALIRDMITLRGKEMGFTADDIHLSMYGKDENFTKADFVMPFCELGDFDQYFESADDRWDAVIGCVDCVYDWHCKGYAHFDIKPENFLGTRGKDSKIQVHSFDLAFSHKPSPDPKKRERKGTIPYCAPEIWSKDNSFDPFATDIYALGITLYQIMRRNEFSNGFPQYVHLALNSLERGQFQDEFASLWELFYARNGFDVLIRAMTNPDPMQRPAIRQVKEILLWIYKENPKRNLVAEMLEIIPGIDPYYYGVSLAEQMKSEEESEDKQELYKIIDHCLLVIYTERDMLDFYEGFMETLPDDFLEEAATIVSRIKTLIKEKQGIIPMRKISEKDIAHLNQRHYIVPVAVATELLGLREGTWTFCSDINEEPWILTVNMGEMRFVGFDFLDEKKPVIHLEDLLSLLKEESINPLCFVPKSFPEDQ